MHVHPNVEADRHWEMMSALSRANLGERARHTGTVRRWRLRAGHAFVRFGLLLAPLQAEDAPAAAARRGH